MGKPTEAEYLKPRNPEEGPLTPDFSTPYQDNLSSISL